jgi:hypothetical protein
MDPHPPPLIASSLWATLPSPHPPLLPPRTLSLAPTCLQGRFPMVKGDPSNMTVDCLILMDQSRGKPLLECMGRELTSSDSTPSRSPGAPEVGTEGPEGRGGGSNSLASCTWEPHTQTLFAGLLKEKHRSLDVT